MDSKVDMNNRIQATKELHNLSKTYTLLIKDLPFVTNLSKFYDEGVINASYNNMTQSKNVYSDRNNHEIVKDSLQTIDFGKTEKIDNPFDFNHINDRKTLEDESGLKVDNKPQSKYKKVDNETFEDMQRQLYITDSLKNKSIEEITEEDLDRIITPEHKESIRKIRELLDD